MKVFIETNVVISRDACAAARGIGAEGIVTRDRTGFRKATVPVLSPAELVATVSARPQG